MLQLSFSSRCPFSGRPRRVDRQSQLVAEHLVHRLPARVEFAPRENGRDSPATAIPGRGRPLPASQPFSQQRVDDLLQRLPVAAPTLFDPGRDVVYRQGSPQHGIILSASIDVEGVTARSRVRCAPPRPASSLAPAATRARPLSSLYVTGGHDNKAGKRRATEPSELQGTGNHYPPPVPRLAAISTCAPAAPGAAAVVRITYDGP